MQKHIIVCDHIHDEGLKILQSQSDVIVENLAHLPKTELLTHLHKADVLITRSSTSVTKELLEMAFKDSKKLKAIVRAGVGVDNVDIDACSYLGVVVMNVPTANTIAAVELTMAHLLSSVRRFPGANHQLKSQKIWNREDWYGTELKDKKLGIIGFGNIGSRVGRRAKAFEMEVIAYDPYIKPNKALDVGVQYTTNFDDILACDVITIHTPKNKQTKNMITSKEIAKMKNGVILINCARGGLYNEDDLYEGLKSKKIAWAGIDVFDKEPATSNKLLELDNIYVTPHIGANTLESQEKIAIEAANSAISAARGSAFPNALNLPTKNQDVPDYIESYLELTQKLGYFAAQAVNGVISSIAIHVYGAELENYQDALLTFGLVGTLKPSLDDGVNYVNAYFVAKDRGISTSIDVKHNAGAYKNLITLVVNTEQESMSVGGTVYDGHIIRFNNINGFGMDLEPKGHMILVKNTDVPGVIGSIGNTIAKHNVNIADFRLGRHGDIHHKAALALILVDNDVTKSLLNDLRSIKECLSVRSVLL
ncbi:phosphoglycerate dehydrogenase [Helicobacter muridarum]|uniref:D-3-phosphoglycerate dehydrogenase n=1 Tax=Helicobacter muridarum TaxID=216 RepID=A0A099TV29_9HELI|nr:phosphoglycerate dehydrogenase [Helicobacter muridarum]TLE01656.1 phosphoglycerate dehydrogenase [Helicobacter muridarum]STQ86280.1 D-3-phosphoglycerate dehydrogenase [Helicobacter muridarum]